MDYNRWLKDTSNFYSMCRYSILNYQVILYDGHFINFDNRAIEILQSYHIQDFILKSSDSVHEQPNNNGTNLKLKKLD